MRRVNVYVDGFIFYHSLQHARIAQWGWVGFRRLAARYIDRGDQIIDVKYFTARDEPHHDKTARQIDRWWKALRFSGVQVFEGKFVKRDRKCRCGGCTCLPWQEKATDVNLGVEMGLDAGSDAIDGFVLLAADRDYLGAVSRLCDRGKNGIVLTPPGQHGLAFRNRGIPVASIRKSDLKTALLPRRVRHPERKNLYAECYKNWRCAEDVI